MRLKVERWESSENQEGVHYFVDGDQQIYVLGYNPAFFSREQIEEFLGVHEVDNG